MTTPEEIAKARQWYEREYLPKNREHSSLFAELAEYAAHVTAEKDKEVAQLRAEIERLSHELVEAEGALWRISPRTHTIEVQGDPCSQKPDPFEGPGETYADAYNRVNEELETWKSVFPDVAPERVLPDRSKLETRLAKLEAVAEAARDALAFLKGIEGSGYGGTSEYDVLVVNLGHGLAALDGEKADG